MRHDEYFVRVTLAESSSAASLRHVLRWNAVQTSIINLCALVFVRNSSSTMGTYEQDEYKMRISSCLGQRSKLLYVVIRGTKVANKGDVREVYDHVVIWALKKSAALQNSCLPVIFCWAVLQVRPRLVD
jgi:hypothetical protein